jgi:hypothetical protein
LREISEMREMRKIRQMKTGRLSDAVRQRAVPSSDGSYP